MMVRTEGDEVAIFVMVPITPLFEYLLGFRIRGIWEDMSLWINDHKMTRFALLSFFLRIFFRLEFILSERAERQFQNHVWEQMDFEEGFRLCGCAFEWIIELAGGVGIDRMLRVIQKTRQRIEKQLYEHTVLKEQMFFLEFWILEVRAFDALDAVVVVKDFQQGNEIAFLHLSFPEQDEAFLLVGVGDAESMEGHEGVIKDGHLLSKDACRFPIGGVFCSKLDEIDIEVTKECFPLKMRMDAVRYYRFR